MIALYEFDNANDGGDKEAVIVPNVPTLINKLSANETNNIKDKINELITVSYPYVSPVAYLELRLRFKGEVGGIPNTLPTLQVGDVVQGFKENGFLWDNAYYNGGDINDRNNYTPISPAKFEPQIFVASATGAGQTFILPVGFVAGSVLKSRGELYKGSEWSQTADVLTIIINVTTGNTIYVKP
jgi:hypothetical protein